MTIPRIALLVLAFSGCLGAEPPVESNTRQAIGTELDDVDGPMCGPSAEALAECQERADGVRAFCESHRARVQAQLDLARRLMKEREPRDTDRAGAIWDNIYAAERDLPKFVVACNATADAVLQTCFDAACAEAVAP